MDQDIKTKQLSGIPRRVFNAKSSSSSSTDGCENPPDVNTRSNAATAKQNPATKSNISGAPRHLKPINETGQCDTNKTKFIRTTRANVGKVGVENKEDQLASAKIVPGKVPNKKSVKFFGRSGSKVSSTAKTCASSSQPAVAGDASSTMPASGSASVTSLCSSEVDIGVVPVSTSSSSCAVVAPSKNIGKQKNTGTERQRVASSNTSARSEALASKERIAALEREVEEKCDLLKTVSAERDSLQNDVRNQQDRLRLLEASLARHGIDPYTLRSVKVDDVVVEQKRQEMANLVPDLMSMWESYQMDVAVMLPNVQEITRRSHQATDVGGVARLACSSSSCSNSLVAECVATEKVTATVAAATVPHTAAAAIVQAKSSAADTVPAESAAAADTVSGESAAAAVPAESSAAADTVPGESSGAAAVPAESSAAAAAGTDESSAAAAEELKEVAVRDNLALSVLCENYETNESTAVVEELEQSSY